MTMKLWQYLAVSLIAIVGLTDRADAGYSNVFFFGDSLSDNGNLQAMLPGVPPSPPYAPGRFSNGPLWSEYFAGHLGRTADPVLAPTAPPGNNYAVAGASVITPRPSPPFTPIPTQMANYLFDTGGTADPSALYVIMGGANDVADFLDNVADQSVRLGSVDLVGSALSQMVEALWTLGAHNILLANIPDFSLVPRFFGDADARALSERFATNVAAIDAAATAWSGLDLDVLDLLGLQRLAIANSTALGFDDTQHACLLTAGCDPEKFFYWDDFHPTTRVHQLIADAALRAIPEPSTVALTLLALLLGSTNFRRWRGVA